MINVKNETNQHYMIAIYIISEAFQNEWVWHTHDFCFYLSFNGNAAN